MNKSIAALSFFSLFVVASSLGSVAPEVSALDVLTRQMPEGWRIVTTKERVKPYWSFSEDQCIEITIAGPRVTGYRYLDTDKKVILEHFFQNEALVFWIADEGFDPKWTFKNKAKNRLSKTSIEFPFVICDDKIRIFGTESLVAYDTTYSKTSPIGTRTAVHLGIIRSWPQWQTDLTQALAALCHPK
jgi:hypothetical protein